LLARGGAADAAIERDLQATDPTLVGADAQQARRDHAIEAGPARIGNLSEEDGGGGRHGGDRVVDAVEQAADVPYGFFIEVSLLISVHGADCTMRQRRGSFVIYGRVLLTFQTSFLIIGPAKFEVQSPFGSNIQEAKEITWRNPIRS